MRLKPTNKFRRLKVRLEASSVAGCYKCGWRLQKRLDSASEAGVYKLGWRLLVSEGDTSKVGSNK